MLENRAYDSVYIIKSICRIKLAEKEYKVFPDCLILVNKGSAMEVTALDSPVFANYFCYREKVADIPEYTEDMRCNELSAIVKTMKSEEMKQQASYRDILGHYGQIFFLVAKRAIAEKETMQKIADFLNERYGEGTVELTLKDSYYNMADVLKDHMHCVEHALDAYRRIGIEPVTEPIRGGTDGARLSFMGLPCPNLSDGDYNAHSLYEFVSLTEMKQIVKMLMAIVEEYYEEGQN